MSKPALLLAPYLVAFALLLAVPSGVNSSVLASESSLLAVANDIDAPVVESNPAEPKKPHYAWLREPKLALVREIKPVAKPKPQSKPIVPMDANISGLISQYASQYGADPEKMAVIAKCESGFNPTAVSPSGTYTGMYQFNATTWSSNRKAMGLDPNPALRTDPVEAVKTAAFKMGRDGYGAWPTCSQRS